MPGLEDPHEPSVVEQAQGSVSANQTHETIDGGGTEADPQQEQE